MHCQTGREKSARRGQEARLLSGHRALHVSQSMMAARGARMLSEKRGAPIPDNEAPHSRLSSLLPPTPFFSSETLNSSQQIVYLGHRACRLARLFSVSY